MLEKEIAELRRRLRVEKNNINTLCGCFVNEKKEILTSFRRSLPAMSPDEAERYLALLRRTLLGNVGKNLLNLSMSTSFVAESEEHKLLCTLRDSDLKDEEAVKRFFDLVIAHLDVQGNTLILLARDVYDVPVYGADGARREDGTEQMFSYLICAICPVKLTKPTLRYDAFRALFQTHDADQVVAAPQLGFLFPAFDDRCANLYGALYATRDLTNSHAELANALFGKESPLPMPAAVQKESFDGLLSSTLSEECSLDVVQTVQDNMLARVEAQKEQEDEPIAPVSKQELITTLTHCGITEERIAAFDRQYDETFGQEQTLCPQNLTNKGKLELRTPDVTVSVDAAHSDLVETRLLDGKPCIIIRAQGQLTVNGVAVKIQNRTFSEK